MARLALVTGASTGIGRACALHLAERGFDVLAGVRNPADAPEGLEPLRLDVTSEADVAAAAERVGDELHALVNNAGIAITGPVEVVPMDEWRRQLEVNLLGQIATPIWAKGMEDGRRVASGMTEEQRRRYGSLIAAVTKQAERIAREGLPPEAVAKVVGEAVTAERPRARYVVGRDAKVQAVAARLLPDRAFDALIGAYLRR